MLPYTLVDTVNYELDGRTRLSAAMPVTYGTIVHEWKSELLSTRVSIKTVLCGFAANVIQRIAQTHYFTHMSCITTTAS